VNISDVFITSAQHARPSKPVVSCRCSQGFLNASEVVHPHAHTTKCQGISGTSSKILESRKKKNLRILEKSRKLQNFRRKKTLKISEKEKSQNLRRRKVSRNEKNLRISEQVKSWNLGIGRILESRQPRAQSQNLATSSAISKQAKSRNLSTSEFRNLQRVKSRNLERVKSRNLSMSEISASFNERNLGISKWAKFRNLGTCEISKSWNRQILGTSSENL
jgi:hypothetical protein